MAKYEDKVVYAEKPDQLIESEDDENKFSILRKKPEDKSHMPRISDAYIPRYKEYR